MMKCTKGFAVAVLVFASNVNAAAIEESEDKSKERIKTGLQWDAQIGLGYDSNIYRAPGSSYIDYGDIHANPVTGTECIGFPDPNTPGDTDYYCRVNPEKKSGLYIPAELDMELVKGAGRKNYLVTSYKFDGELYMDSDYDNANNYSHKFRLGDEYVFKNVGSKRNSLYVGGLYEHKKRLYLDRDTGEEQTSSGNIDISNRYTYDAIGLEAEFKNRVGKWQYNIEAKWSDRDYEDPVAVSQYDHKYQLLGGDVKYHIAKPTKLTLGYQFYTYDYDERPSRNSDGKLTTRPSPADPSVLNPSREYEYNKFDITLRHRFNKSWLAYFDYERKNRKDKYMGYDNYAKDLFKVRVHYDINKNNKIKFSYAYWERDYPNAYAFDNKSNGIAKQYDGTDLKVSSKTKLDKHKSIVVDFKYVQENSTDLRYDYDRYKAFVSFQWEN